MSREGRANNRQLGERHTKSNPAVSEYSTLSYPTYTVDSFLTAQLTAHDGAFLLQRLHRLPADLGIGCEYTSKMDLACGISLSTPRRAKDLRLVAHVLSVCLLEALGTANGKAEGALVDLIGKEAFSTARIPILGLSGVYDNS